MKLACLACSAILGCISRLRGSGTSFGTSPRFLPTNPTYTFYFINTKEIAEITPSSTMDNTTEKQSIEEAKSTYHLSSRGACNALFRDVWGPREKSMGNPWSQNNLTGTVILRLAETSLLHDEVADFSKTQINVQPINHLTYSTGPRGSRELMAENYRVTTSFLADRSIKYYEMNAGLFIWVDLRHLFRPELASQDSSALKIRPPIAKIHKKRELQIIEACTKHGVLIAPGSVYIPEEYGWFRITFTLQQEALKEGLERLWKSLEDVESNNLCD
ncbi:aminotransferase sirI [Penicillium brevicompactum]|uniref:Aminotransferase sirI n=1 Tax=Penicillium brevicompactum TaxID=5074 RepID=A0A9W9QKA1_PENBR|nr:aminotransferase sirI [Penicillium brevicompactum]